MAILLKPVQLLLGAMLVFSPMAAECQTVRPTGLVDQVGQKVAQYLTILADLHCTESVTQEKLTTSGHVEIKEHAKYDYLIMMQGGSDDFQLNETRVADAPSKTSPLPASMLVSNGIATALLVFHPYYRDSFKFDVGVDQVTDGRERTPIYFEHIAGRRSPAALALRGREYPLELKGTAWVDRQTDEVVRMDVGLLNDMSDIGLHALQIHVEYKPVSLGGTMSTVDVPAIAVVDVTTAKQHWRNTHVFEAYKSFSIDVVQGPGVTVHDSQTAGDGKQSSPKDSPAPKE